MFPPSAFTAASMSWRAACVARRRAKRRSPGQGRRVCRAHSRSTRNAALVAICAPSSPRSADPAPSATAIARPCPGSLASFHQSWQTSSLPSWLVPTTEAPMTSQRWPFGLKSPSTRQWAATEPAHRPRISTPGACSARARGTVRGSEDHGEAAPLVSRHALSTARSAPDTPIGKITALSFASSS